MLTFPGISNGLILRILHSQQIGVRDFQIKIWDYALKNDLIILTRDSDYFYWMIQAKKSPEIVYFKLQQQGRKELEVYFELNWTQICELSKPVE